jgi:hypothetical protein
MAADTMLSFSSANGQVALRHAATDNVSAPFVITLCLAFCKIGGNLIFNKDSNGIDIIRV